MEDVVCAAPAEERAMIEGNPMRNCSTCGHWDSGNRGDYAYFELGLGKCLAVPQFWDSTKWDTEGEYREFTEKGDKAMAFTQDASDYKSVLLTRPEFWCVMWLEHPRTVG